MMPTISHHAAALGVPMMPYDTMGYYEQPRPRLVFKIPRTVPDQKGKFENDELFRKLSRESEVKYTGSRNQTLEERQAHFRNGIREGHTEIAFSANGTNLQIFFDPNDKRTCDFTKEHEKVHLKSHSFIMNGVTVLWRGYMDLKRLDGSGCLEFEEKFTEDKLFVAHSKSDEHVKYVGMISLEIKERRAKMLQQIKDGFVYIGFTKSGIKMVLDLKDPQACDFDKESNKVHLTPKPFIMNGVCVRWRGWLDLENLEGAGRLEFDKEYAAEEHKLNYS